MKLIIWKGDYNFPSVSTKISSGLVIKIIIDYLEGRL